MENFWGALKNEFAYQKQFPTRQQSIQETTEYTQVLYNRQRKRASLGYLSPANFTQAILQSIVCGLTRSTL
jgi:putative transposase